MTLKLRRDAFTFASKDLPNPMDEWVKRPQNPRPYSRLEKNWEDEASRKLPTLVLTKNKDGVYRYCPPPPDTSPKYKTIYIYDEVGNVDIEMDIRESQREVGRRMADFIDASIFRQCLR